MSIQNKIQWTRINNDTNGNPRHVCHFLMLLTQDEKNAEYEGERLHTLYEMAIKRAKAIGGRKFHNKQYGGGIVFQSYNITDIEKQINDLLK